MINSNMTALPVSGWKRALALSAAVIMCFLLFGIGNARADSPYDLPDLPWTDGKEAYQTCSDRIIKPQCGPGYDYKVFKSMNGSKQLYYSDEITRVDICFRTGDWIYAGFGYSDKKWRFGFFHESVFAPYDGWDVVPEYPLNQEVRGTVTEKVVPRNGPDWSYPDYISCKLSRGDTVYACMQSNDWYLCRFYNGHTNYYGYVYLWVPGSAIRF